jgi:hypothetical protein
MPTVVINLKNINKEVSLCQYDDNQLKIGVEPTPEMSFVSNIPLRK